MVSVWRTGVDWRSKRPFLSRATAHLSIIALALAAIFFSGITIPSPRVLGSASGVDAAFKGEAAVQSAPAPTLPFTPRVGQIRLGRADVISREPAPHTTIPDRLRAQVITYTVRANDTIFDIAKLFGLSPETIVWSNREALQDAPWLIHVGLQLFIPPVDGIYHTVLAGETIESLAALYQVEPAVFYNEWNGLEEGDQLREGQLIVVPGGKGDEIEWEPPRPQYAVAGAASYSYGVCNGVTYTGEGANGWFIYPTGSARVSGWYFRDRRNPGHIGIDYRCRLGDPLYASDNGVVTIAGWNGGYGILIELNHGNGFVTRYAHLSDLIVGCGEAVYQGQLIGYCGSTGWSSGAHLHFELRYNNIPQDPQNYLP